MESATAAKPGILCASVKSTPMQLGKVTPIVRFMSDSVEWKRWWNIWPERLTFPRRIAMARPQQVGFANEIRLYVFQM
jgi:hypothetical protein